jgi:ribosome-associated protein
MENLVLNNDVIIPESALTFKFSRSGGKGGQNVNKVATKVEVTVTIDLISASDEIKRRIKENLSHRLDSSGALRIVSQESRSQWKNKQIVLQKLYDLITEALLATKERIATKRTKAAHKERIEKKILHSKKKSLRQKKNFTAE